MSFKGCRDEQIQHAPASNQSEDSCNFCNTFTRLKKSRFCNSPKVPSPSCPALSLAPSDLSTFAHDPYNLCTVYCSFIQRQLSKGMTSWAFSKKKLFQSSKFAPLLLK